MRRVRRGDAPCLNAMLDDPDPQQSLVTLEVALGTRTGREVMLPDARVDLAEGDDPNIKPVDGGRSSRVASVNGLAEAKGYWSKKPGVRPSRGGAAS